MKENELISMVADLMEKVKDRDERIAALEKEVATLKLDDSKVTLKSPGVTVKMTDEDFWPVTVGTTSNTEAKLHIYDGKQWNSGNINVTATADASRKAAAKLAHNLFETISADVLSGLVKSGTVSTGYVASKMGLDADLGKWEEDIRSEVFEDKLTVKNAYSSEYRVFS